MDEPEQIEQTILKARFPLDPKKAERIPNLVEVGRMVGYTRERTRQIQNQALEKIRRTLETHLN
ncbi:MAG: hypothetical protein CMJ18_10120 [Phycisphaeraceae bacterium]|nr:hypothetical protein [Phycisphaeraceae bacterium]